MGLLDIKNYMMKVRMASLSSLCIYFNSEANVLRDMLAHWVRKGNLRQCMKTPKCGVKCGQCSVPQTEIYEWVAT
jgi:hypothetical protein